jgi:hypothetical protein
MADDDLTAVFKPPWRILRHKSGNYQFVDATGRNLCWLYVRGKQVSDHKLLDDAEAQLLAKATARLSRAGERGKDTRLQLRSFCYEKALLWVCSFLRLPAHGRDVCRRGHDRPVCTK